MKKRESGYLFLALLIYKLPFRPCKNFFKNSAKHLAEIRNRIIFKIRIRIYGANMDERSFFYNLGKLAYQLDGVYEAYGKNCKIGSPNLLWILYALNDGERHSQKQICVDWDIPRSTANTIIKDLESKHYITLSQIKGERRELLVSLTESGKKYADGILSDLYRREREIYSEIESPEALLDTLQNLAIKMQKIAAKGE